MKFKNTAMINFHPASPILRVSDLATAVSYYENQLGFHLDWSAAGIMVSVSRGPCNIMLAEGDQGNFGTWVWIGVGDVAKLFEEFQLTKAIIRHGPVNYYWAYEMQVQDPDGNVLRFGSEPKADMPFGDWLDMYGKIWKNEEKAES